jgi:hypothetical protein
MAKARGLRDIFVIKFLSEYFCEIRRGVYSLWRRAVMPLLQCGQTYFYEKRVYGMMLIRTRQRVFLQLGSDFIMAVFNSDTWN